MGGDFTPENAPEGSREMKVEKAKTTDDEETNYAAIDDISRKATSSGVSISGTYETAQDYIDALNENGTWVSYDEATNTATITSIADFTAAVNTEINLALALENYSADIDVEFTTVWGLGHTEAERSGDSTSHFINWVNECLASQS